MSDRRSFLGSLLALTAAPLVKAEPVEPQKPELCGAIAMRTVSCGLPLGHEGKHHAIIMGRRTGNASYGRTDGGFPSIAGDLEEVRRLSW